MSIWKRCREAWRKEKIEDGRKTEDSRQKAEGIKQKTEDGRKVEDGGREVEELGRVGSKALY